MYWLVFIICILIIRTEYWFLCSPGYNYWRIDKRLEITGNITIAEYLMHLIIKSMRYFWVIFLPSFCQWILIHNILKQSMKTNTFSSALEMDALCVDFKIYKIKSMYFSWDWLTNDYSLKKLQKLNQDFLNLCPFMHANKLNYCA